jgi:hypothetical protein
MPDDINEHDVQKYGSEPAADDQNRQPAVLPPPVRADSGQNETAVSFSPRGDPTDEELSTEVRAGMAAVEAGMRAAVDGARRAGAALIEMKKRVGHGHWEAWVRDNFDLSSQTARLYMRVAKNWDRVVEHGLDELPDLCLRDLRYFLPRPDPGTKPDSPAPALDLELDEHDPAASEPIGGAGAADRRSGPLVRPEARQLALTFGSEVQRHEFKRMARGLMEAYRVESESDAAFHAVKTCYEEVCRG